MKTLNYPKVPPEAGMSVSALQVLAQEIHQHGLQEHLPLSVRLRRVEEEREKVGVTDLGASDAQSVEDVKSADDRLKSKEVVVVYDEGLQRIQFFGGPGVERFLLKGHRHTLFAANL